MVLKEAAEHFADDLFISSKCHIRVLPCQLMVLESIKVYRVLPGGA
jgi:hypothetical protein